MTPLADLRVVEWGGPIAAPYCTKLLAEFGARVDKVEPPDGDPARALGPFEGDVRDAERSGLFAYLNAGKRSVVADPATPAGRRTLDALLARADVWVTDRPLAQRRALGLDGPALRARHPSLVVVALSVFGEEGPYADAPAQAIDAYALSGTAWVIGEPGRPPLSVPLLQADWQAGAHGAAAALMAVVARHRDARAGEGARGESIDVSSADVFAAAAGTNGLLYLHHGLHRWVRAGRRAFASGGPYPYAILPCRDGAVCLIGRARHEWARLVKAMGEPAWTREPRYQDLQAMGRHYPDEVDALIVPWLMRHTRAELLALAERHGFPLGPLRTIAEVLATPQLAHRGFFRQVAFPDGTLATVPGVPWRTADTAAPPPARVPRLGEHTRAVEAELAVADGAAGRAPEAATGDAAGGAASAPARRAGPLAHLRVIDFGWVWSGPLVSTILAEFGAQVIKVEHGARLDSSRLCGRPVRDGRPVEGPSIEVGPYWHQVNHDKLSVTVDLKSEAARGLLDRLVAISDVVVENLSPGALARAGMGWERLSAINPRLVYLSMSAAGQDGPAAGMRAYAPIMSGFCGFEGLVGYPGEPPVGMMNFGYGDPNAAVHALLPLLAAIRDAQATGVGRHVDVSQIEAMLAVTAEPLIDGILNRREPAPAGNAHPTMAPHGIYPAAGDDRWVSIAVADDAQWRALVDTMGAPAWALEPALAHAAQRVRARGALDDALAAWTARHERDALVATLRAAGIACSPVLDLEAQWADPHFAARGLRQDATHPISGPERLYRTPWRMERHPPAIRASAPLLGQHNDHVFGTLLGLAPEEIARLRADGTIA